MRSGVLRVLIAGLGLAIGCAQNDQVVTARPTPEELPNLPEVYATPIQASIAVEDQVYRPRAQLVPDFKEPELTPEEKAALGEDWQPYKPLLAAEMLRSSESLQGTWYGGQETYAWGIGAAEVARLPAARLPRAFNFWGGQDVGVDRFNVLPGHTYYQISDWARMMDSCGGQTVGVDRTNTERARALPRISK